MFTINYVSSTEKKVVKEEQTLEDAKRFCGEWEESKKRTTDDGDNWCRLVVCEVLGNGDLYEVHSTGLYGV